ncbi:MAG: hypothetical protein EOT05_03200 [Candidatus Microsaccharimonas sossegonensis]|uniref:Uncharacterized protein n=1 Tax=Candidatus Microsaccharimonas sossegonensis TaxID=2506948 RepID=A0A4Q0AI97_9BACT|nr:MAG: hypothetical protein EOT05_03200 [Candidatus Microsaccharimonas sossegonensis]
MSIDNNAPGIRHPRTRGQRFLPHEALDWFWTSIVAAFGLVTMSVLAQNGLSWLTTLALVPLIIFWGITMYTPKSGKFNERLYQIPITLVMDWWTVAVKHHELFRSEQSVQVEQAIADAKQTEAKRVGNVRRVKTTVDDIPDAVIAQFTLSEIDRERSAKIFPLEVRGMVLRDGSKVGLIFQKEKRTYSMVFKTDGSRFRSMSHVNQYLTIKGYADLIKQATVTAGLRGLNIAMGVRNRPQDQWLIPETMKQVASMEVIMPEAILSEKDPETYTLDDKMNVALYEMQAEGFAELTVQSYSTDMVLVVTVKENDALRKAFETKNKKNEMSEKVFRRLTITRIKNIVFPKLDALVGGGTEILDVEQAERYLRKSRDVTTLFDYYNEAEELLLLNKERQHNGIEVVGDAMYDRYLPVSHVITSKTGINVDGTYATVLDMTEYPREEALAHEMADLTDAISRFTSFSVIGQSHSSNMEYIVTNNGLGAIGELADNAGIIRTGPRAERRQNERYDELRNIDESSVRQNYVIRFAALESSEEDLEEQIAADMDRFATLGYTPVQVSRPSQQWKKFLTTVTLIDCE